jgi:endonuclease-3
MESIASEPDSLRPPRVAVTLAERYGLPMKPRLDPLDELILTILSQSTTDRNRDRAWDSLRQRYPAWDAVRLAPRDELEDTVRVAGLATQKAAAIQSALHRLVAEVGSESLDHLDALDDAAALDYLSDFQGVGIKTAACVLCFALGRPILPVDTHVHRVARRLGWIAPRATPPVAHHTLNDVVPDELRFALHIHLIQLGRETCTARRPRCHDCPLADECPRVGIEET